MLFSQFYSLYSNPYCLFSTAITLTIFSLALLDIFEKPDTARIVK